MTALLVVLAVLGWSLALALIVGRSIALRDERDRRQVADMTDRLVEQLRRSA